jgi:hypothetical protein
MNIVVLTSVLSAGNHALFSGTRVLYGALNTLLSWIRNIHPSIQVYPHRRLTKRQNFFHGRLLPETLYSPY